MNKFKKNDRVDVTRGVGWKGRKGRVIGLPSDYYRVKIDELDTWVNFVEDELRLDEAPTIPMLKDIMKISREDLRKSAESYSNHHGGFYSEEYITCILGQLGFEVEEPKARILSEEWGCRDGHWYDKAGGIVSFRDFKREVAALPDLTRALEKVRREGAVHRVQNGSDIIRVEFSPDQWRVITDALEKAGIK